MRTLSSTLITELGLTVTRPGYLVSVGFSTPQYYSTLGDVTWGGHTWTGTSLNVSGLKRSVGVARTASLAFADSDLSIGAIVLNEGIADREIRIYAVYAGAADDAVLELIAAGDACEITPKGVTLNVVGFSTHRVQMPRRYISADTGFNVLQPWGTPISINGQPYYLTR